MAHETNSEGLTWLEWLNAARLARGITSPRGLPGRLTALIRDWRAGVDPTEYAHGA